MISKNRFYTFLMIPEKTAQMKRWILPSWLVHSGLFLLTSFSVIAGMMAFDYWHLLGQIQKNKELQIENRKLRQQVQLFENKISLMEGTLERLKSFSTRLKVIMNLEGQSPHLQKALPEAHLNLPELEKSDEKKVSMVFSFLNFIFSNSFEFDQAEKEYAKLSERLTYLNDQLFEAEVLLQDQYEMLYDKRAFLAALPTRQPAAGYFTSGFGVRQSPLEDAASGGRGIKMHEGIDIANRTGTGVFAPAAGEVTFSGVKTGYGLTLILNHGYGLETLYGHLQKFAVKKGDRVKRGDRIAFLGNTGVSTAPHVHYEVHVRGYPVDPRPYLIEPALSY